MISRNSKLFETEVSSSRAYERNQQPYIYNHFKVEAMRDAEQQPEIKVKKILILCNSGFGAAQKVTKKL